MFRHADKIKRYDYRIIVNYKIKGRHTDVLFPLKPQEYYTFDVRHCENVYTDVDLTDVTLPRVKEYISELLDKYKQPENIEKFHRTGNTIFTNKPIYTFGEWFERDSYVCKLEDIECVSIVLQVDNITELTDIPDSELRSQIDLEAYLQLTDYYTKKIATSKKKTHNKTLK